MDNDYMIPVRDAATEIAAHFPEAQRAEVGASLRMFAHAVLDAGRAEAAEAMLTANRKAIEDELARPLR